MNGKFKRTAFLYIIFCNIIKVLTVTFDRFNVSFPNVFLKILQTPNFLTVLYPLQQMCELNVI